MKIVNHMRIGQSIFNSIIPVTIALLISMFIQERCQGADWKFRVRYSKEVHNKPFTGRVYLFFSKKNKDPRFGPDWFNPGFILSKDVKAVQPEEEIIFSSSNPVCMEPIKTLFFNVVKPKSKGSKI